MNDQRRAPGADSVREGELPAAAPGTAKTAPSWRGIFKQKTSISTETIYSEDDSPLEYAHSDEERASAEAWIEAFFAKGYNGVKLDRKDKRHHLRLRRRGGRRALRAETVTYDRTRRRPSDFNAGRREAALGVETRDGQNYHRGRAAQWERAQRKEGEGGLTVVDGRRRMEAARRTREGS